MGVQGPEAVQKMQASQANWKASCRANEGRKAQENGDLPEAIAKYKEAARALKNIKHDPKLEDYIAQCLKIAKKQHQLELEEQRKAAREKAKSEANSGASSDGKRSEDNSR